MRLSEPWRDRAAARIGPPEKNFKEVFTMEERNYRKSIKHLKTLPLYWLWMPIIHFLLLFLCYCAVGISLPDDLGSVKALLLLHIIYTFAISPIMSILYCKKLRKMGWTKYLCCIYNAFMIGIYLVLGMLIGIIENRPLTLLDVVKSLTTFPCLSVFIPALICGLVTLIVYDVKRRKTEDGSLS